MKLFLSILTLTTFHISLAYAQYVDEARARGVRVDRPIRVIPMDQDRAVANRLAQQYSVSVGGSEDPTAPRSNGTIRLSRPTVAEQNQRNQNAQAANAALGLNTNTGINETSFRAGGFRNNRLGDPSIPSDLTGLLPNGVGPQVTPNQNIPLPQIQSAPPPEYQNNNTCLAHIDEAETRFGIPQGILRSIAYVESNYAGGPWPWTLNLGGSAAYFRTKEEAIARMGTSRGLRQDMAVGCVQIYARWHGMRFRSPEHMIDPRTNVFYGAYYLKTLFDQYGSWQAAVGRYHSSNKSFQNEYLCRVVNVRVGLGMQTPNQWFNQSCRQARSILVQNTR